MMNTMAPAILSTAFAAMAVAAILPTRYVTFIFAHSFLSIPKTLEKTFSLLSRKGGMHNHIFRRYDARAV